MGVDRQRQSVATYDASIMTPLPRRISPIAMQNRTRAAASSADRFHERDAHVPVGRRHDRRAEREGTADAGGGPLRHDEVELHPAGPRVEPPVEKVGESKVRLDMFPLRRQRQSADRDRSAEPRQFPSGVARPGKMIAVLAFTIKATHRNVLECTGVLNAMDNALLAGDWSGDRRTRSTFGER